MNQYRYHSKPGCGGCFMIIAMFLLLAGGAPLLFEIMGILLIGGLFFVFILGAAFWGFTLLIKHKISNYERSQTESHNEFVHLLIHILMHIASIDGRITKEELNTIFNFFRVNLRYSYDQMLWVKELAKEAQQSSSSIEDLIAEFKGKFGYEPRLILLELIFQVIYSGEKFVDPEVELAQNIADFLDITPHDQQTIRSRYVKRFQAKISEEIQSYQTLGLEKGVTMEQIKSAYRKLSMKYHPDKVGHLGDEFKHVAEEKMKDINIAYNFLKNHIK